MAAAAMAGDGGLDKALLWMNSSLAKVLTRESVNESMPPDLRTLLFQGENLSSFLRDYHNFSITKKWDEKAMLTMFPLFVCEELGDEVYDFMLRLRTWSEQESSLSSRFPEHEIGGR
ncbi:hypothetical protein CBR_g81161, partial [Chara braunii]